MWQTQFSPRRIYILGNGSILDEGISHRLVSNSYFQVVSGKYSNDAQLLKDLAPFHPEIILVTESDSIDLEHLINVLMSIQWSGDLRILVVRLEPAVIDIFDLPAKYSDLQTPPLQHSVSITKWDDLPNLMH